MRRSCFLLLLAALGSFCFAQVQSGNEPFQFDDPGGHFSFTLTSDAFRPVQMNLETEQNQLHTSIFADAPLWVKDLRRGEIVFFGTLPFTVFFTRTILGLFIMGQHNWDQRYAPWPFQSAGAVTMTSKEVLLMFSIAGSASLVISLVDHLIVKNKRKAALASDY